MPEGEQQIRQQEQAGTGDAFDQAFLKLFSDHHYAAIVSSQDCLVKADLEHAELKNYCEAVVGNQTREIDGMRRQLCKDFNVCDFQPGAAHAAVAAQRQ